MDEAIRVLLVDDHALVRAGLVKIIEEAPGLRVVGEAGSRQSAIDLARALRPDVVLLDLEMPDVQGFDLLRDILTTNPQCRVVIVSMHIDRALICQALEEGASGYVSKAALSSELPQAVREVHSGCSYVSRDLVGPRPRGQGRGAAGLSALSPKEVDVVRMIIGGATSAEIAQSTKRSMHTVQNQRRSAMQKLGVRDVASLVLQATRLGLRPYSESAQPPTVDFPRPYSAPNP